VKFLFHIFFLVDEYQGESYVGQSMLVAYLYQSDYSDWIDLSMSMDRYNTYLDVVCLWNRIWINVMFHNNSAMKDNRPSTTTVDFFNKIENESKNMSCT
jgi:hypothetical protein